MRITLLTSLASLLLLLSEAPQMNAQQAPAAGGSADKAPAQDAAMSFDGSLDGFVVDGFQYQGDAPLTVEAWLQVSPESKGDIVSIAERGGFALQMIYGQFWFSMHDGKRVVRVKSRALEHFGMVHIAGVFDGKNLHVFINGVPSSSPVPLTGHYRESRVPLTIACGTQKHQYQRFFRGGIAALRISSCVRYADYFNPPNQLTHDDDALLTLQFDGSPSALYQQVKTPLTVRSVAD